MYIYKASKPGNPGLRRCTVKKEINEYEYDE